jgi:hypothetical protein
MGEMLIFVSYLRIGKGTVMIKLLWAGRRDAFATWGYSIVTLCSMFSRN